MKRMVLIPEERLLQYERQQRDPVSNDTECDQYEERENDVQNGSGEEKRELSDDIIVRGIPKTMRTRALALLERLRARADVISWDDMGQVKIDGVLIPKSNISDLVSNAMRSRKNFDPVASREFFDVLSKLNVPKDLVRNEEGLRRVAQKGKGWGDQRFLQFTPTVPHSEKSFGGFTSLYGEGRGKHEKPTQKGKGEDWAGLWDFMKPIATSRKKRGKVFRTMGRQLKTYGQKGKGDLISPGAWYQMGETERKGLGRRERSQKGGFTFGPYTQGLTGIERKRRPPQKGKGFRKIPNWECYKG